MPCTVLCKHRTFPLESNNLSNSFFPNMPKRYVALGYRHWKINRPKHPKKLSGEKTESGHLAVPKSCRGTRQIAMSLKGFSPLPDPCHSVPAKPVTQGLKKRGLKWNQPPVRKVVHGALVLKKHLNGTYTHETGATSFQILSVLFLGAICTNKMR